MDAASGTVESSITTVAGTGRVRAGYPYRASDLAEVRDAGCVAGG